MKFDNQLRYGSSIIAAYRGEMPLHAWLKIYFREHKQMGSRDRRLVSDMVYGFYRLGYAIRGLPVEERILAGLFLSNDSPGELLQHFKPGWNENVTRSAEEKISIYRQSHPEFGLSDIFPWKDALAEGVDPQAYSLSFLRQPDLFLRIRPGHEEAVIDKLKRRNIDFVFIPPFTVRLPNGSRTEEWFAVNKEIVIQDYCSQRTAPFLQIPSTYQSEEPESSRQSSSQPAGRPPRMPAVWDACAASGGKSLLAYDVNGSVDLTVSDIRDSMLRNLKERFREAGIKRYRSFVADLSLSNEKPDSSMGTQISDGRKTPATLQSADSQSSAVARRSPAAYDLVIADVPCSGSGTWGRTPEELYFFDKKKIGGYRELQRRIVSNLFHTLRPGGYFVYITCSVFREENEEQVGFILEHSDLKLEKMELLKGYDQRADTLFVARFTR